ncbi:MAG: choice-of-anchor K domain-containing protein [Verrucomicrobiales bacterium]
MNSRAAFSLVEALIVVSVIGLIASLSIVGVNQMVNSAKREKLLSDVRTLNRGVMAFRATGGDLSGANSPEEVLDTLKQGLASAERVPGMSGAKIDPRISFVMQTAEEANSTDLRAYWQPDEQRFAVTRSGGTPGIKLFVHDAEAAERDYGEAENKSAVLYAAEETWIWDYEDVAADAPAGPTEIPLNPDPDDETPPASPPPSTPPPPTGTDALDPPIFSVPSSSHSITSFDLTLSLTDPNPAAASSLYYSVDYGAWTLYSGPIQVGPDANVAAQAIAVDDAYTNSSKVDHAYTALPFDLRPPVISTDIDTLGLFVDRTATVTLLNPNDPTVSRLRYQINGGGWVDYDSPFLIDRDDYRNGATILATAVPFETPYYLGSSESEKTIYAEKITVTGDALGSFHDPVGEDTMVTNLAEGDSSSYFEWGEDQSSSSDDLSKSWLEHMAGTFNLPHTNERFEIGELSYYNGQILGGTGADRISLGVDLNLVLNQVEASSTFEFDFDLVNVPNHYDSNDPWRDADYVKLTDPVASESIVINGIQFQFQLEFGESTSSGISLFDEFHVLEDHSATTKLYGTLIEVGSVEFNDDIAP